MSESRNVGIQPWFPWPLSRWPWLTESIPAERAAALRIATAVVLLIDLFTCYLPHFHTFFSADALGGRERFAGRFRDDHFHWSVLRVLPDEWGPQVVFAVWLAATIGLLIGWRPLVCGLIVWVCALSVWTAVPGPHNGGDRIRNLLLLIVPLSCSGAVWGVSSVRTKGDPRPVLVPGWPVKVLFVQLAVLYFFGGFYKVRSDLWRSGYAMYWASHDLWWSLCPAQSARLPDWVHRLSALVTIIWELGFPILASMRRTRAATLIIGIIFHVGTLFTLDVGPFALYSIAYYAAFAPWERLRQKEEPHAKPQSREEENAPK